jgi:hypothetical protein
MGAMPYSVSQSAQVPALFDPIAGFPPVPVAPTVPVAPRPSFFTGTEGDIITPVNSLRLDDITQRSFIVGSVSALTGFYVNSRDRNSSNSSYVSIRPLYQFQTTAPQNGEADPRVMPWRDGIARNLELSFGLRVAYVRRADEGSHAISHPTVELLDTRSRRNIYVSIGVAQTVPLPTNEAEDYFAADVNTGKTIVATSFRVNPSFGQRIQGESFFCSASAVSHVCNQSLPLFAFRLRPADIEYVIAKARKLDVNLSPNIADYAIDNFSFNNEVLNNAELGLTLREYKLTIREQQY